MASALRSFAVRLVVLGWLLAGTVGFFTAYERYEPIGPELLVDPTFGQGLVHWTVSGRGAAHVADDVVILQAARPSADVAVRQTIAEPGRYRLLRLEGMLEARSIRPGAQFFHKGRLALVSFDAHQRMLPVPHVVVDLTGTQSWRNYQGVFRVPEAARELRVSVQLIGATGELAVKRLSLRELREREVYTALRWIWLTGWMIALVWLGLPLRSRLRWSRAHALAYAVGFGVFVAVLLPADLKVALEIGIGEILIRRFAGEAGAPWLVGGSIDKLGHVLFFALLALVARRAWAREPRAGLVLGLLLLALVSEVLQFFVDGRLPRLTDFLIDGAGLALGLGLYELLQSLRRVACRCESNA